MDRDTLLLAEDLSFLKRTITQIFKKTARDFKRELINQIDKASEILGAAGKEAAVVRVLNRHSEVRINRLSDLKKKLMTVREEKRIEEGALGDWWKEAKGNAYNALAFYPILTMFLELDKVIEGVEGADIRTVLVYLLIWVVVISGKVEKSEIFRKLL